MMSRRSLESGQIQFSVILSLLVMLGIVYLIWAVFPAVSDEIEVRQALHAIANDGWHHGGRADLQKRLMDKLATIGSHAETTTDGVSRIAPGLGLQDEDVTITCTDRTQDCTEEPGQVDIQVRYERVMPLPLLTGKNITLRFHPHADATLKPVNW